MPNLVMPVMQGMGVLQNFLASEPNKFAEYENTRQSPPMHEPKDSEKMLAPKMNQQNQMSKVITSYIESPKKRIEDSGKNA